jgi:hypothetical protein
MNTRTLPKPATPAEQEIIKLKLDYACAIASGEMFATVKAIQLKIRFLESELKGHSMLSKAFAPKEITTKA